MAFLYVKNWQDFQHYKDRSPPWIKLHKTLLDNYEFQCLPLASRALAPMFWLLASENLDGKFDADLKKLSFRLRCSVKELEDAIKPLIDNGFLESDSNMLADCKQESMTETETETETEKSIYPKKTHLPKNFTISDRVKTWATKNNHLNLENHLENFILSCKKNNYQYADWDSAFMTAIRDNWAKIEVKQVQDKLRNYL